MNEWVKNESMNQPTKFSLNTNIYDRNQEVRNSITFNIIFFEMLTHDFNNVCQITTFQYLSLPLSFHASICGLSFHSLHSLPAASFIIYSTLQYLCLYHHCPWIFLCISSTHNKRIQNNNHMSSFAVKVRMLLSLSLAWVLQSMVCLVPVSLEIYFVSSYYGQKLCIGKREKQRFKRGED